jgi:hypothetical protein
VADEEKERQTLEQQLQTIRRLAKLAATETDQEKLEALVSELRDFLRLELGNIRRRIGKPGKNAPFKPN